MSYASKGSTSVLAGLRNSWLFFTWQDNKWYMYLMTKSVKLDWCACNYNEISTFPTDIYYEQWWKLEQNNEFLMQYCWANLQSLLTQNLMVAGLVLFWSFWNPTDTWHDFHIFNFIINSIHKRTQKLHLHWM